MVSIDGERTTGPHKSIDDTVLRSSSCVRSSIDERVLRAGDDEIYPQVRCSTARRRDDIRQRSTTLYCIYTTRLQCSVRSQPRRPRPLSDKIPYPHHYSLSYMYGVRRTPVTCYRGDWRSRANRLRSGRISFLPIVRRYCRRTYSSGPGRVLSNWPELGTKVTRTVPSERPAPMINYGAYCCGLSLSPGSKMETVTRTASKPPSLRNAASKRPASTSTPTKTDPVDATRK